MDKQNGRLVGALTTSDTYVPCWDCISLICLRITDCEILIEEEELEEYPEIDDLWS